MGLRPGKAGPEHRGATEVASGLEEQSQSPGVGGREGQCRKPEVIRAGARAQGGDQGSQGPSRG